MRMKKHVLNALSSLSIISRQQLFAARAVANHTLASDQEPIWLSAQASNQHLFDKSPSSIRNMSTRAPVIALSHGGGPMPLLGDPSHKDIVESLRFKVPKLLRLGTEQSPRAIIIVTAHWSERKPHISSGEKHNLEFDYYGFPDASYKLKYNAPGSPGIAQEIADALKAEGLEPELDDFRGWDHGVFVPMLLINPDADVPIVQMSVLTSEDPEEHYKMGRALNALRDSNVAIIGSGFASYHNVRTMMTGGTRAPGFKERNDAWGAALDGGVKTEGHDARLEKLKGWREWPHAYESHPRNGAEHFMPLIVCAGAGSGKAPEHYVDEFLGLDIYSYYWEE